MINKKIILTDLDGTLVKDSHSIRKEDLKALRELKRNYILGIATGRSIKEITYLEEQNNFTADIKVGFNGAIVTGLNDTMLFNNSLKQIDLNKILSYLRENKILFDALNGDERIGTYASEDKKRLWGMNLVTLSDPYERISEMNIYKFNVRPGKRFNIVFNELKKMFPNLSIYEGGTQQRIEISAEDCSKGTAVKLIKNTYGHIVFAVGDSGNDVPMFEAADKSFCMSHANEDVIRRSDYCIENFADLTKYLHNNEAM